MAKTHPCDGCVYMGTLPGQLPVCNYIFAEDKRRPCPPGEGCTAKVVRRRRRTSAMSLEERRARDAARKREARARLKAQKEQMKHFPDGDANT